MDRGVETSPETLVCGRLTDRPRRDDHQQKHRDQRLANRGKPAGRD
jgi:hypothetical protein